MPQLGFHLLRPSETRDDGLVLRRYMADWKFTKLLDSSSLYISPASKFQDKLEGHYTHLDNELSDRQLARWGIDSRAREMAADARAIVAKHNQKAVVICCWTAGTDESLRMWSEYGEAAEAVALETTVGRLRHALGTDFLLIVVTYLDFSLGTLPKQHSLQPFLFKQSSFAWEREVRAVGEMEIGKRIESPRLVPIALASVFQKVIVSPSAPDDYRASVESRLSAASLAIPVHDSALR